MVLASNPLSDLIDSAAAGDLDWLAALIEIGLLTWLFYVVLRFAHGTRGLAVMKGAVISMAVIFFALVVIVELMGFRFPRLEVVASELVPFVGVVLVILFQPELRTGLTRLSERGYSARVEAPAQLADFTAAVGKLARRQTGALVVFEQATGLRQIQASGVPLDSLLSGALVESIFYPKSPLHDGAVIVREGRIVAASCMLPLTESRDLSRDLGTRHRAALGLTEETDSVAVVVSEETGRISVAHRGLLHPVDDVDELLVLLTDLLQGYEPGLAA